MKAVVQKVNSAKLYVENVIISEIKRGFVVYFCVEKEDSEELLAYFAKKISKLRIFEDENGKMNLSLTDVGGEILLVSQFTLAGSVEHGFRPSFTDAEEPKRAEELYLCLAKSLNEVVPTKTGVFGAMMRIVQENVGPVTIIIEKNKE